MQALRGINSSVFFSALLSHLMNRWQNQRTSSGSGLFPFGRRTGSWLRSVLGVSNNPTAPERPVTPRLNAGFLPPPVLRRDARMESGFSFSGPRRLPQVGTGLAATAGLTQVYRWILLLFWFFGWGDISTGDGSDTLRRAGEPSGCLCGRRRGWGLCGRLTSVFSFGDLSMGFGNRKKKVSLTLGRSFFLGGWASKNDLLIKA